MAAEEWTVSFPKHVQAYLCEDWKRVLHMNLVPMRWWHWLVLPAAFIASQPDKLFVFVLFLGVLHQPHVHSALRVLPVTPRQYTRYIYTRFVLVPPLLVLLFLPVSVLTWESDAPYLSKLLDLTLTPAVFLAGLSMAVSVFLWAEWWEADKQLPARPLMLHLPAYAFYLGCMPFTGGPFFAGRWSELQALPAFVLAASACAGVAGFIFRKTLIVPLMHQPQRRGSPSLRPPESIMKPLAQARIFASWQQVYGAALLWLGGIQLALLLPLPFIGWPDKFRFLSLVMLFVVHIALLHWCLRSLHSLRPLPLTRKYFVPLLLLIWASFLLPPLALGCVHAAQGNEALLREILGYLAIVPGSLALCLKFPNRIVVVLSTLLVWMVIAIAPALHLSPFLLIALLPGLWGLQVVLRDMTPRCARLAADLA